MGWSNYIIIPEWRLLIETKREVDDIQDYEEDALEKLIEENNSISYDEPEIDDVEINAITIKQLSILYNKYKIYNSLSGLEFDKLLLFWLNGRGVDYEIKSEHYIDKEAYQNEGYNFLYRS